MKYHCNNPLDVEDHFRDMRIQLYDELRRQLDTIYWELCLDLLDRWRRQFQGQLRGHLYRQLEV